MTYSPISPASATDWIRIFACHWARRRPNQCPAEVIAVAIAQFKRYPSIAPEIAVAQIQDGPASPDALAPGADGNAQRDVG